METTYLKYVELRLNSLGIETRKKEASVLFNLDNCTYSINTSGRWTCSIGDRLVISKLSLGALLNYIEVNHKMALEMLSPKR